MRIALTILLLTCALPAQEPELIDASQRTAAYYWDGKALEDFRSAGWRGESKKEDGTLDGKPSQANASDFKSRFLKDGDNLLLMTPGMRRLGLLHEKGSWAVYNESGNRMVVHGTKHEHWKVEFWRQRIPLEQKVVLNFRLLKVRCRELGVVDWSAGEPVKRGATEVVALKTTLRDGEQARVEVGEKGSARASLECEAQIIPGRGLGELKFLFRAVVPDGPELELASALSVYSGCEIFAELGSQDAEHSYLLGVRAQAGYLDGTALSDEVTPEVAGPWDRFRDAVDELKPVAVEKGLYLQSWKFVGFLEFYGDPFDPDNPMPGVRNIPRECPKVGKEALVGIVGFSPEDEVVDVAEIVKEQGGDLPKGAFAFYNKTTSQLIVQNTKANLELCDPIGIVCWMGPFMVKVVATLVRGPGQSVGSGRPPVGLERLARAVALSSEAKTCALELGRFGEGEVGLLEGFALEVEPQTDGFNLIDLRYHFRVLGDDQVELTSAATLRSGRPIYLPLGGSGEKQLGVLLEAVITFGDGTTRKWNNE